MATRSIPPRSGEDGQMENPDWRLQVQSTGVTAPPETDDEPLEESAVDRVFSVLETARTAERATVKLYRVGAKPGQFAWCDDYTVEEFEAGGFAMIREKWGPGEYEIRLYAIRPTDGRFGVLSKPRITIEAGIDAQRNPIAPPAPTVDPAMREMLAQMAANQAAMLQALTNRPDPMANMQQMLSLAASFKQAFGGGESSKSTITEIVGAIRELKGAASELVPEKSGADADDDSPMKLLPSVLDLVGRFAPQAGAQSLPMPAGSPGLVFPPVTLPPSIASNPVAPVDSAVSSPVTQSHQVSNDVPNDEEMNAIQIVLFRGYLGKLCGMSAGGNVEEAASFVVDKMPNEAIDVLELPNWFEMLAQFYPGAASHREWLEKVRVRVLQIINEG